MSNIKILKKGEYLFKEGEKIQTVYIIQSGQVCICLQKNKKNIDLMNVGSGYVFADLIVLGQSLYTYSGLILQETKVVELPLEGFRQQYDGLHQIYKSMLKTTAEKLKWAINEIKNTKSEKNSLACPEESIPKVFGTIFHVVNHKGIKDNNQAKVDWQTLKQYSQRIFGESLKRLEQATQLLVKLKLAEYIYGKNPEDSDKQDGKDEIQGFKIFDLAALESFFEFYQYYYYKASKSELIKFDEANYNTLRLLIMAYQDSVPDKFGIVSKDFNEVVSFFSDYGVNLGAGHFTSLETKGIFCKRKSTSDNKVLLQFEIKEFKTQIEIWKILKEIDKWNEKGFIDLKDIDDGPKKKQIIEGIECQECHSVMSFQSKFCSECGVKLILPASTNGQTNEKKAA